MKSSVKKFLAIALVGGALFGATGASAHDWDNGRHKGYNNWHGYDKKVVHVHKHKPVKYVYKRYESRPKYVYHDHRNYYSKPDRLIIGFNF